MKLFRWDVGRHIDRSSWAWIAVALLAWVAVGLGAAASGRLKPVLPPDTGSAAITDAQINGIVFRELPGDDEIVTRLAPLFKDSGAAEGVGDFAVALKAWPPGHLGDSGQCVRNLLCVAAIADVSEDPHEGEIARLVLEELKASFERDRLQRALAWDILYPQGGTVITSVPELGLPRHFTERIIRERSAMYAEKFIGRLLGKIHDR